MPSDDIGDSLNPITPIGKSDKEESSDTQELKIEALIDYIATTPQNINYNIVREIIKAIILDEPHPYFDYYEEKMKSEETEEQSEDPPADSGEIIFPTEPGGGSMVV